MSAAFNGMRTVFVSDYCFSLGMNWQKAESLCLFQRKFLFWIFWICSWWTKTWWNLESKKKGDLNMDLSDENPKFSPLSYQRLMQMFIVCWERNLDSFQILNYPTRSNKGSSRIVAAPQRNNVKTHFFLRAKTRIFWY